jgi:hypothetical protein
MSRAFDRALPILLVIGAVAVIGGLLTGLGSIVFPEQAEQTGSGLTAVLQVVAVQSEMAGDLTGFDPILDLSLLFVAYVLVCLFMWSQDQLRIYLANRSHFK